MPTSSPLQQPDSKFGLDRVVLVNFATSNSHRSLICASWGIDPTQKCHHIDLPGMGVLRNFLKRGWDEHAFWAECGCDTICERDESLIKSGLSSELFGEGIKLSEEQRQALADGTIVPGLTVEQLSFICDGDHLFGRSWFTNGITRVQGCPHRENIIRSWVRGRFHDWLLPGRVGVHPKFEPTNSHEQANNNNIVPIEHTPRLIK